MDVPLGALPEVGGGISILLVDDQPANLLALKAMLRLDEVALVEARSGPEALRRMLKQDFALVLLDVVMPGMDGFEAASLMRQRRQSRRTPVIFLTAGSLNETHVSRGYSLGAVDYIYKPIIPEVLKAKVQVFVDLFQATRSLARSEEALRRELDEHKIAQAALRESEQKYRELFSRSSDAVVVFDAQGERIVDANEAALSLYGYSRREFLRLKARDLWADQSGGAMPGKQAIVRLEKKKDGTTFEAEGTRVPLTVKGRRMIMSLKHDITERRKAQEAEGLRQREALQRQFVATVSHELRTPISAIKASAESLRLDAQADAKIRTRFMSIIENQTDRLSWLVEDLLVLSELESGKVHPEPSRVRLSEFVERLLAGIGPLAARKGVSLKVDVDGAAEVWVDQAHLARIISNLLDNAIKYNRKGGTVEVAAVKAEDGQVRVSVRDTGIGIRPEDLPLIFQQFYRTRKAREVAVKGTGLGLYIIRSLVESNGGRIWAESGKDGGSVFQFTLPLANGTPAPVLG